MRKILLGPLIDPSTKITEEVHDEYCLSRGPSHTLSVAQRSKHLEQSLFQAHGHEPRTAIMSSRHQGYEQNPKAPGNPAQPRCDFSSNPADGLEPYQGLFQTFSKCRTQRTGPTFTLLLSPSSLVYHLFRVQKNCRSLDLEEIYYIGVYCDNIFKIKTWGILIRTRK